MEKELVMYIRGSYCPGVALARDLLTRYRVPFREVSIDQDPDAVEPASARAFSIAGSNFVVSAPSEIGPTCL